MFGAPLCPSSGAHDDSVGYHIGRLVLGCCWSEVRCRQDGWVSGPKAVTRRQWCYSLYFYSKTNIMHQYIKFILFWNDTLHVSDGLSVHHQEFKPVIIQSSSVYVYIYIYIYIYTHTHTHTTASYYWPNTTGLTHLKIQDCKYRNRHMSNRCLLLYAQSWTPDDGRKYRLKHLECYSKIK